MVRHCLRCGGNTKLNPNSSLRRRRKSRRAGRRYSAVLPSLGALSENWNTTALLEVGWRRRPAGKQAGSNREDAYLYEGEFRRVERPKGTLEEGGGA